MTEGAPIHRSQNFNDINLAGTSIFPPHQIDKHGQPRAKIQTPKDNNFTKSAKFDQGPQQVVFQQHPRSGFSGGFKVPEETRHKLEKRKYVKPKVVVEDEKKDDTTVNKDEILAQLNLQTADNQVGGGKIGANSKSAVQRDVIESLQKDLDKLRREEDGIKLRKALATGKPIIQETEEEKKAKFDMALRNDLEAQNVQVVEATEARIQAIRYKPGGLDSLKALSLEEIDKELEIIKKRNSYIEQHYWSKQQNSKVGAQIRKNMGLRSDDEDEDFERQDTKKVTIVEDKLAPKPDLPKKSALKSKPVKQEFKPKFGVNRDDYNPQLEKSQTQPNFDLDFSEMSPKRLIHESKFQKYKANKEQKLYVEERAKAFNQANFDNVTKINTPNQKSRKSASKDARPAISDLIPEDYEENLLRQELLRHRNSDPFQILGIGNEDKLIFFLLKWKFNQSQIPGDADDEKSYILKTDLIKEFMVNDALRAASGIQEVKIFEAKVKNLNTKRKAGFNWEELLNFFFKRDGMKSSDCWWEKLDQDGKVKLYRDENGLASKNYDVDEDSIIQDPIQRRKQKLMDNMPVVQMTPALQFLINTRRIKTEQEVEEQFNNRQHVPKETSKKPAKLEDMNIKVQKSEILLMPSQVEVIRQLFQQMDTHGDTVLQRSKFIMKLRTDEEVVSFIQQDAVKTLDKKVLTLDQILIEVEKDEMYELKQRKKEQINTKQMISWNEFYSYLDEYRDIDERNQKLGQKIIKHDGRVQVIEEDAKSLLEIEKQRRIKMLPKLRPADQIDITEDQLKLIKGIYDSIKVADQEEVTSLTFFVTTKQNPKIKQLWTTLARDPEGTARMPKETFQQVFERMELENTQQKISWPTIVEYFTKRGRPLTSDEIQKFYEEDQKNLEEMQEIQRIDEQKVTKQQQHQEIVGSNYDNDALDRPLIGDGPYYCGCDNSPLKKSDNNELNQDLDSDSFERDEQVLNDERITVEQYKQQQRKKKPKFATTIPKPFAFDTRDKTRPKSIKERRFEMEMEQKQADERAHLNTVFRSKPIPPEVLQPRFNALLEENEQRRMRVKQQSLEITRKNEQPFSFWARDQHKMKKRSESEEEQVNPELNFQFKANPIPKSCSVLIFTNMIKQQEEDRKKRIIDQAQKSFKKASMPSRMQKDLERKKSQSQQLKPQEEFSFQPKINEPKTAQMFQALQKKFEEELKRKKAQVSTTKPVSPRFTKTKVRPLERDYVNQQTNAVDKFKAAMLKKLETDYMKPVMQPSSTRSMVLLQQRRREELNNSVNKEKELLMEQTKRKQQQNRLKDDLQDKLKSSFTNRDQEIRDQAERKRLDEEKLTKQRKDEMAQRIENARNRGYLIDNYDSKKTSQLDRVKNLKAFSEKVATGK